MVAAITVVGAALRLVVLHDSLFADELSTYWIVSGHSLGGRDLHRPHGCRDHPAALLRPRLADDAGWT